MNRPSRLRQIAAVAAETVLYTLLAAYYLRPIASVYADHLAPGPGDPVLNLYFLKWGMHQIALGLPDFWNANVFFPLRGALTLSDHLIGPAFLLTLLRPVLPSAVAGYNLLFFGSFVGSALATSFVLRRLGCSRGAATLGGALFAFCPFRWSQLSHLQVLLMQWLPLTLWSFDRLLEERTVRRAAAFLLLYALHATGGCYLAYMVHVPLAAIAAMRLRRSGRELLAPRSLRILVPVAVIALALLAALFVPYVRFSRQHDLARNPRDIAIWGATLSSYLSPAPGALYFGVPQKHAIKRRASWVEAALTRSENALFPGLLAIGFGLYGLMLVRGRGEAARAPTRGEAIAHLAFAATLVASLSVGDLATHKGPGRGPLPGEGFWWAVGTVAACSLVGLWRLRRRRGAPTLLDLARLEPFWAALAITGAASFLLSLPAFYVPAMRLIPGFSGMRVSARFGLFVTLALVFFAARGVDDVERRISRPWSKGLFWIALALFAFFELGNRGFRWFPVLTEPRYPPVYRWLARPEVVAIAEIPMTSSPAEMTYMLHSTAHWKPIANGHSGYDPPLHQELARRLRTLPNRGDLERLRQIGVSHLVLHAADKRARWSEPQLAAWEGRMAGEVERVFVAGSDSVYAIRPPTEKTPNLAGW